MEEIVWKNTSPILFCPFLNFTSQHFFCVAQIFLSVVSCETLCLLFNSFSWNKPKQYSLKFQGQWRREWLPSQRLSQKGGNMQQDLKVSSALMDSGILQARHFRRRPREARMLWYFWYFSLPWPFHPCVSSGTGAWTVGSWLPTVQRNSGDALSRCNTKNFLKALISLSFKHVYKPRSNWNWSTVELTEKQTNWKKTLNYFIYFNI